MFETGTVFWIVIAYSFIGYALLVAGIMIGIQLFAKRNEGVSLSPRRAMTIISLLLVAVIATGPLSWFMTIKNFRRHFRFARGDNT
jgi:uncharacterized membrane protein HdeD (DUF308 family)